MARPMKDIDGSVAGELYNHFLEFIDKEQAIPIERAFWRWLIRTNKYTKKALPEPTFRYHFGRLIREGYIRVEHKTRSLVVVDIQIIRKCEKVVNSEIESDFAV